MKEPHLERRGGNLLLRWSGPLATGARRRLRLGSAFLHENVRGPSAFGSALPLARLNKLQQVTLASNAEAADAAGDTTRRIRLGRLRLTPHGGTK